MPLIPAAPRQSAQNGGLPPVPLGHHARRLTSISRSHTTNIDKLTSNSETFPPKIGFQPRPLRNIHVVSKSPSNGTLEPNGELGSQQNGTSEPKNGDIAYLNSKEHHNGTQNGDSGNKNLEPRSGYLSALRNGNINAPNKNGTESKFENSQNGHLTEPKSGYLGSLRNGVRSSSIGALQNGHTAPKYSYQNGESKSESTEPKSGYLNSLRNGIRGSSVGSFQSGTTGLKYRDLNYLNGSDNESKSESTARYLKSLNNGIRSSSVGGFHNGTDPRYFRSLPRSNLEPKTGFLGSIRSSSVGAIGKSSNLGSFRGTLNGQTEPKSGDLLSLRNGIRSNSIGAPTKSAFPSRNGTNSALFRSSSIGAPFKNGPLFPKKLSGMNSPTNSISNISRSVSPCSSFSMRSTNSPTPRRIFPQMSTNIDLSELEHKEQSPVVFDANLTFVIGCKTPVRQNIKPVAAHLDKSTASNLLSEKISEFLKRTDHVMDEWKELGHKDDDEDNTWAGYHNVRRNAEERRVLGRSRSATNIMIKGFQYFSRASSVSRAASVFSEDRFTDMTDFDELSEMTADLAEEHSTSTLATERLDAETQERLRLERELTDTQLKNRTLQQSSERLEMELLYARSDLNGLSEEEEDGDSDGVYKQRYERAARELEFIRRRLQQQHEDDLEQLVGLKKQLEKKLSDAYEEVEEQRQVVGQWKRKVQKLNAETNDLRLLLEEQNARNNLLEKKQRKFDAEAQLQQDELRQERQSKDRISREKEIILAEKFTLENVLADTRMELELREEKLTNLQRELDELTFGGKTEEEVTLLRKQKMEMERKLHEQEEELDELAGQTQLLEQAKLRLEMSLEQLRKESKREAQQRDEELEEARCNAQKKVKALEAQLENEHEERTLLLREKHELDRRLASLSESQRGDRAMEEAQLQRLRRDLRRTKALLRDAQTMIERHRADGTSRVVLRQLRNQLEDAECARSNAVKARQQVEGELSELQAQLEEVQRQKAESEDRFNGANRERTELRTQLEENEEELAEVLKKYRSAVQQASVDQLTLQEQVSLVSELEAERGSLKERLAELATKLETMESLGDPSSNLLAKRMELKCKELESKLELEQTTRSRLEVQIARLKETVEKLQGELIASRTKEQLAQDQIRKLQRSLRELRDEHCATATRESECLQKRKELEKKIETCEAETSAARSDLKLALKRIDDLQSAIQGELEDTLSDHTESDPESYSSDESIETFLANHKLGPSNSKNSIKLDSSSS